MKISNRSHKSRKTVGAILAVAVVGVSFLASERSTRAIDYTWIGNFGGSTTSFNDPTQWTSSGGTFPGDTTGSADTAQITGAVTGVVNINLNTVLSTPLTGTTLTTTSGSSANATANLNFNISAAQTQSLGTFVLTSGSATVGRVTAIATASASAGATTLSNANLTASTGSILSLSSLTMAAAANGDTSIVKADGGTLTVTGTTNYGNGATITSSGTLTAVNGGFLNLGTLNTDGTAVQIQLNGGSMKITNWVAQNNGGPGINVTGSGNFDATGVTINSGGVSFPSNFTFASSGTTTLGAISLTRTISPVTGSTNDLGLHIANGVVNVANSVGVDNGNSSGSGEIHSGTLTVGGSITIGFSTSPSRWSQFLVAATGVVNATTGGVQIGSAAMGSLGITGGTLSTSQINFGTATSTTMGGTVGLGAGNLYLGSASISTDVLSKTASTNLAKINLNSGTLGATADWLSAADMTLGGTTSIKTADLSNTAHNISLSGVLSGAGGFTKIGGGKLSLNGASLYSGATAINAGVLNVTNTTGSATGTSAVTVASGAQVISPAGLAGSMNGAVTIQNGGTLSPGGTSVGTLTMSNLTLAGGSNLVINFNDSSNFSQIAMGGTGVLSYNSTVNVFAYIAGTTTPFVFPASGDFTLISGITNGAVAPIPQFTLAAGDTSAAGSYAFQITGGKLQLHLGVLQDLRYYWSGSTSTTWGAGGNWDKVNAPNAFPDAIGDVVEFNATKQIGGGPVGNMTPTLTDNRTAGVLDFNATGYTLGATNGTLNLQGAATSSINLGASVDATISAPLALGTNLNVNLSSGATLQVSGNIMDGANGSKGLTATGSGIVTLSGTESYSGTTTVNGGSLVLTSAATFGNGSGAVNDTLGVIVVNTTSTTLGNAITNGGTISITGTGNTLANITNSGQVAVGGSNNSIGGSNSGTISLAGTGNSISTLANTSLILAAPTTVATVTTAITGTGSLQVNGGTLALTGSYTSTSTTNQIIVGNVAGAGGTLSIGSNSIVNLSNAGTSVVAGNITGPATFGGGTGVINVNGGTLNATGQIALATVANSVGVLNMNSGLITTSLLAVGVPNNAYGNFKMNGGSVIIGTNLAVDPNNANAGTQYSAFTMTNGFLSTGNATGGGTGFLIIGANNDNAMMLQTGGTITIAANNTGSRLFSLSTANSATSYGVATFAGNAVFNTSATTANGKNGMAVGEGGFGILNIEGNAIVTAGNSVATAPDGVVFGRNNVTTSHGILNLGGGTLTTSIIRHNSTANTTAVVNFHGGVLQAFVGTNSTTLGTFFAADASSLAFVYSEGVTIDDGGATSPVVISHDLIAPTGTGISVINLAAANLTGYTSAPIIKISGGQSTTGDTYATAYATINDATGAINSIVMSNPGINYIGAGTPPTVTIVGGGKATVVDTGSVTFNAGNTAGDLTKRGSGTVALTSANNSYRNTIVSAGTLMVGNATATGSVGTGSVSVAAAGKLAFNLTGNQTFTNAISGSGTIAQMGSGITTLGSATVASLQNFTGSVNVTNGTLQLAHTNAARQSSTSGVLVQLSGLTIAPGSSFDITNHDLIIHYGSESAANAGYTNLFASAASAFAGGSWSGKGLTTSEADATQNGATVIMIESGDDFLGNVGGTFDGHAVTNGDVLVKYTLFGDVNLDGVTNDGDLGLIFGFYDPLGNGGLGGNGPMVGGDSNYDGFVGDGDLGAVFNLYDPFSVGPGLGGGFHGLDAPSTAAVPEPASLALLGIAAIGLVARRRRKN